MGGLGIAAWVKSGDAIKGVISERDIVQVVSQHGERALSLAVLDVARHATVYREISAVLPRTSRSSLSISSSLTLTGRGRFST
jgi:hypothetical protein